MGHPDARRTAGACILGSKNSPITLRQKVEKRNRDIIPAPFDTKRPSPAWLCDASAADIADAGAVCRATEATEHNANATTRLFWKFLYLFPRDRTCCPCCKSPAWRHGIPFRETTEGRPEASHHGRPGLQQRGAASSAIRDPPAGTGHHPVLEWSFRTVCQKSFP